MISDRQAIQQLRQWLDTNKQVYSTNHYGPVYFEKDFLVRCVNQLENMSVSIIVDEPNALEVLGTMVLLKMSGIDVEQTNKKEQP